MLDAKIEDAICRLLQGLEKYRDAPVPPDVRAPKGGSHRYKKWTRRKLERLVHLWEADVPRKELPAKLGSTMGAVQAKLNKLGLKERDRKRARMEASHAA
jgi:hypothetical protein